MSAGGLTLIPTSLESHLDKTSGARNENRD
jgi:hypothetical protein